MPWNPETYNLFERERSQPFEDLLALVRVRPGLRVVDLGCGTGVLTTRLSEALPGSDVLGIDSSPEMLDKAHQLERPGLRFSFDRIEDATGEWDLVFSNAAIHWVEGHERLVPRLFGMLTPGGQVAVQVPSNHGHATHRLITEIASSEPYRGALNGWTRRSEVLPLDSYAGLLYRSGAQDIVVLEKIYPHVLKDSDALADWTSGTALVPYIERLPVELHEPFMSEYRKRLAGLFPSSPVFYPFRRTLFSARRPA